MAELWETLLLDRPISVTLGSLDMTELGHDVFFSAAIDGLSLSSCQFFDAVTTAASFAGARVKCLNLFRLGFEHGNSAVFATALSQVLSSMLRLEKLDFGCWNYAAAPESHYEQAIVALIQAAGGCPCLEELCLSFQWLTSGMDACIAKECIGNASRFKTLVIRCQTLNLTYYPTTPRLCFPAVLEAVSQSYSVQTIKFEPEHGHMSTQVVDPWDPDMVKMLNVVLQLNRAGRSYIAADATNKNAGVGVLETVVEDLDCLYFHLLENPLLFGGGPSPRRRKK